MSYFLEVIQFPGSMTEEMVVLNKLLSISRQQFSNPRTINILSPNNLLLPGSSKDVYHYPWSLPTKTNNIPRPKMGSPKISPDIIYGALGRQSLMAENHYFYNL